VNFSFYFTNFTVSLNGQAAIAMARFVDLVFVGD
jgi:hypothetical protein